MFRYRVLPLEIPEENIATYCQSTREEYSRLTKRWSQDANSEWIARHYLSLKMLLSATVMLTSESFAESKNIRITTPYLLYYALLSCSRAVVFTSPSTSWGEKLLNMTHQKIINVTENIICGLSKEHSKTLSDLLKTCRSNRELFSYRFPASGMRAGADNGPGNWDEVVDACRLLGEVAQLRSECMESSVSKNVQESYQISAHILDKCFVYESESGIFLDEDDWQRIGFHVRKMSCKPLNLKLTATEGLVEDYFGSWTAQEEDSDQDVYNPDEDWRLIFPFP